jgi:tetrahydromethanopterin S-methyltransferase subunit C
VDYYSPRVSSAQLSVSALTWFIRYMSYLNLQFLNNVIINKTKVLPQT